MCASKADSLVGLVVRRELFQEVFDAFVRKVVLPHCFEVTGATTMLYQAFPCVRIIRPGEFSLGPHSDTYYGFSPAQINFVVPLTCADNSSALHVESFPGKEDWHGVFQDYGSILRFWGALCIHFTIENCTNETRASLDFRVIPDASLFDVEHDQFTRTLGYYATAERVDGEWKRLEKSLPVPDKRNGIPFL